MSGVIVGILTVYLQVWLYAHVTLLHPLVSLDYTALYPWLLGELESLGALTGDALKSFFKRQHNIPPGKRWIPFDQLDYVIGGVLLTAWYIRLTLWQYVLLCLVWLVLHPLGTLIADLFKLKERPL